MWVNLADEECVDVEKLTHSLHGEIAWKWSIYKLILLAWHEIRFDLTLLSLYQNFLFAEDVGNSTTGYNSWPHDYIRGSEVIQHSLLAPQVTIGDCNIEIPFIFIKDFEEGHVL